MVDWTAAARQENGRRLPFQLCRDSARQLPSDEQINEPTAAKQQHPKPQEHPAEVKDLPQTVRGLCESSSLYDGQAA